MAGLDYKVEDRSILLPFYKRLFINPFVPHIPRSIHPNVITHAGHVLNLAGTVLLWVIGIEHAWACVAAAIGLHAYLWCDNADGAHARNTGQTSTYGEFLDHGLDQLNTAYIGALTAMALAASPAWFVATVLLTSGAAAITYWEQSVTGVFRLGLLNQVESLSVLSLALLTTAIFGPSVWMTELSSGVTLQIVMLGWMAVTIVVGAARAMVRVAHATTITAITPIALYVGVSALVVAVTQANVAPWWVALAVASSLNVYYGMRMLALRLSRSQPGVEPIGVIGAAVLTLVLTGAQLGLAIPASATLLGLSGALVVLTLRETRRGLAHLAVIAAIVSVMFAASPAVAQPCRPIAEVEAMSPERAPVALRAIAARGVVQKLTFPRSKSAPLVASDTLACPWSPSGALKLGALGPISTASAAAEWVRTFEESTVLEYPWPVLEAMAGQGAAVQMPANNGVTLTRSAARATLLVESSGPLWVVERTYPRSGRSPSDRVLARLDPPKLAASVLESSSPMPVPSPERERARALAAAHMAKVLVVRAALADATTLLPAGDLARAKTLNVEGYELHKRGQYAAAVAALRGAVAADPTFGQAHYNLACSLARARTAHLTCEVEATRSAITRSLEQALKFMPSKRAKLLIDPDLVPARDTFGWQKIAGKAADPRAVLRAVTWFGPAPGAFGPMSGLSFRSNGRYTAWVKLVDDAGVRIEKSGGKYTVDGARVRLVPDVKQGSALEGTLDASGTLTFSDDFGPFTDDPSDCSA